MKRLALTDDRKCYADMALLLLALTLGNVAGAQSVPLPEYYGIYAIDKGKLVNLFGGRSSQQPTTRTIELFSFKSGSSEGHPAMELSPDVRFLVFDQSPVEASQGLYIYRSPYARNLRVRNPDPAIMGGGRDRVLAINKRLAARVEAFRVGLAAKPVPGQPQMVEVVPEYELPSGTYLIYGERERKYEYHWFVVGSPELGEASDCIDLDFEFGGFGGRIVKADYYVLHGPVEFLEITKGHYVPCGSSVGVQPSGRSGVGSIHVSCDDYTSCLNGGVTAFNAHRWDESLPYFQEAARLEPEKGAPWVMIGGVYFETGSYDKAWELLDKGLRLGATVGANVCRERALRSCQRGTFLLSSKQVTLIDSKGQKVFSAPPSEVTSQEALRLSFIDAAYSRLKISGKNYSLYLIPEAVRCKVNSVVECPEPGFTQQKVFANYVHHALTEIKSGAFDKPPEPPPAKVFHPVVPGGRIGEEQFHHRELVIKLDGGFERALSSENATHTHVGVDLAAECSSPIYAFADGVVKDVVSGEDDENFDSLGYMVLVQHNEQLAGEETYSIYLHMNERPVANEGDRVQAGTTILGYVGDTGAAEGCHTHFEVRHFGSRFLKHPDWNNIYGTGDQRDSDVLREKWEDPEVVSRLLDKPLI